MSSRDVEQVGSRRRKAPDAALLERLAETGFLATEFGLHQQAELIFSCLVRLKPGKPSPHIALAMVQARRGRMEAAITSLREVIDKHPDSELARAVLGTMLVHIGDAEGRELLEGVIARDIDADAVGVASSCVDQASVTTTIQSGTTEAPGVTGAVEYFRHYNVRA
ncbi:MAG TPA: HrpB1 family type III secretion system apparatus protein [Steroidobacter sp.]